MNVNAIFVPAGEDWFERLAGTLGDGGVADDAGSAWRALLVAFFLTIPDLFYSNKRVIHPDGIGSLEEAGCHLFELPGQQDSQVSLCCCRWGR